MRRRETSTEGGQLVVAHPVDVDAADRTAESQRRDHRTDGPVDRVGAGVLHAPGPILLPVERPQASLEYAGLADLLAVRCRVQLRLPRQKSDARSTQRKSRMALYGTEQIFANAADPAKFVCPYYYTAR